MSRSMKSNPVFSAIPAESDASTKKHVHGARRVRARAALTGDLEELAYVEGNAADHVASDKGPKAFDPALRVQRDGKALRVLGTSERAKSERAVHKALAK